jgi:5'-deoxynucleotidase YfbR-like HD superfamily hydrolase
MKAFTEALLCGNLQRASHVFRYSSRPVIARETVAEHSFYVALYALIIGRRMGTPVLMGTLLGRAVAHDLDESLTGDFQRSFKYANPSLRLEIAKAANDFMLKLMLPFGNPGLEVFSDWEDAKENDLEGAIIKVADFLAVVAYIIKELRMGNHHLMDIVSECEEYGRTVSTEVAEYDTLVMIIREAIELLEEHRNGD